MTLHPTPTDPIPADTARAVRSASRRDNPYLLMRDRFGTIFADLDFAALYPPQGQPGYPPWRLALVTLVQYIEHLADAAVAEQVALRLDLKYLLGLELGAPGFDPSILSAFRTRLVEQEAATLLFDRLLERLQQEGLVTPGGQARTDSTVVVAAVRHLNLLALVRETLRYALNSLALVDPAWLRTQADPAWVRRYARPSENERLPQQATRRRALERTIGEDGSQVLRAVYAPDAPAHLRAVPAVQLLRTVWLQRYYQDEHGIRLRRREREGMPPASQAIASPYDPDARRGAKREEEWIGYKEHLTECCDPTAPHLLLQAMTTKATVPDRAALPELQQELVHKDLPPDRQLVDGGYGDADNVVASRARRITLVGPLPRDTSWQAQTAGAFDLTRFAIDWAGQTVRCPAGQQSVRWTAKRNQRGTAVIVVLFPRAACQPCPLRGQCTRSARRQLMLRPRAQHEALQAARAYQETAAFKAEYAPRAGVEGTISQGVRRCGIDRCRYRGEAKTRFQEAASGAALNYLRVAAHLAGQQPARTRRSALERLFAPAA